MKTLHVKQQYGIFLSSTNDPEVRKYRLAAREVIEEEEFRDKWYAVEMDKFTPSGSTSLEECKNLVLSCSVYIGILGPFYGSVNDEIDLSYTEYEYTVARDAERQIGIFLLPDNILAASLTEIIKKQGGTLQRQDNFKSRVNAAHMNRPVNDIEDFRGHIRRYVRSLNVPTHNQLHPSSTGDLFPGATTFDRQSIPEKYSLQELNAKAISDFLKTSQAQLALDRQDLLEATQEQHLQFLGIVHGNGRPTLGAFLCFAPFGLIVDKFASCSLHMVVYSGTDKANSRTVYKEEAEDNLINLHRIGMKFFRSNAGLIRVGDVGTEERDELEIPTIALREALANALIHRDYENPESKEQPTRIEIFSDRVEVISFGGLVSGVSEELLNENPRSVASRRRNPVIAKIFMYMQIVELGGSGVIRMHDAMRRYNLPLPEIVQIGQQYPYVKVTFFRPRRDSIDERLGLRVYISSTSRDLRSYRQAAIETCNQLGLIPVAMELTGSTATDAITSLKEKIHEADVYVGIFAHRYGYVPEGSEKSITEIEFDFASELGIELLNFVIDPDYPWPPGDIDFANGEKLKQFKDRMAGSNIRSQFTSVEDFALKLSKSLVEWRKKQSKIATDFDVDLRQANIRPFLAPPIPALFIGRENEIQHIKERLGIPNQQAKVPTLVITGWAGVGKTALAVALAYDAGIREAFPDGILWSSLGEHANPFNELMHLGKALNVNTSKITTLNEIVSQLRSVLNSKKVLIIVDDVWNADHALPFKQLAVPDGAVIITTRFASLASQLAPTPNAIHRLSSLDEEQSFNLLRQLAPKVVEKYPDEIHRLVNNLEGLPLALRVAGRLLETEDNLGFDLNGILAELSEVTNPLLLTSLAPEDRFDPKTGTTPTISLLLEKSIDKLDPETRNRFALLGALAPDPATFDLEALKAIWEVDDPMPTVRQLVNSGLLEPVQGSTGRFRMHRLLIILAQSLLPDEE
ncbi:MAG: DUF4062 domain-containing protein [Anaerolineae bacterium]|nr:DUF4062 domain-containing protein [Anaerolineae bacterium]